MSRYVIDGANNPTLTLTRGQTYEFNVNASVGMPHPFWITTALGGSDVNANAYSLGVTNHDASQARRMTALGGYSKVMLETY